VFDHGVPFSIGVSSDIRLFGMFVAFCCTDFTRALAPSAVRMLFGVYSTGSCTGTADMGAQPAKVAVVFRAAS